MNDLPEEMESLAHRVDELEKRVHKLEHPAEALAAPAAQVAGPVVPATPGSAIERASGVFPVLGRAMLGIAGAYVLRAVVESGSLPRLAVAAVAIAYAVAWLVWATRAAQFAGAVYAGTSALILGPMLWELTLRFRLLSPAATAGVLAGFVLTATALEWKRERGPAFWVAYCAAAVMALLLSIATHVMLPFIAALLLMLVLCEYCTAQGRGSTIRPLVAGITDFAVWMMIFMYSGPEAARAEYPPLQTAALLAPACLLFAINAASVAAGTIQLRRTISVFETLQAIIAFLLAVSSVLFFQPAHAALVLGVACLGLAAATYAATFVRFRGAPEKRNFRVFAAWSAALLLAGALWSLPPAWAAVFLGLAALAAVAAGVWLECVTLDLHGVAYLVAGAFIAGLPAYALDALAGPLPPRPAWTIFVVSACAVLCYAVGRERVGEAWQQQLLHFVPALLASCAVAALLVEGLLRLVALFITPDLFHLAFIRTLTVCSLALALAFGGRVLRRLEMTRIAYAAVAFMAVKLIFEDLREGRMDFIAVSIFLFAVTLIAVPRLGRMGHKT
ncbi:MAG: hypothetical protein KGM96_00485 [Acidobacteriota bacterium]|nr:hypothetical protein [Acidobacteriota bacterium]